MPKVEKIIDVLNEVRKEVTRAKELHPGDFHNRHEAYAVILEEVDELWELIKMNPKKLPDHIPNESYYKNEIKKEAIQTAAMLVRLITELC